jgi:hypothetical protein
VYTSASGTDPTFQKFRTFSMKSFKDFINKRRQSFQKRSMSDKAKNGPTQAPVDANPIEKKRVAAQGQQQQVLAEAAPGTLQIALQNKTNSDNVHAYITGLALDRNNAPLFVQADGQNIYYPVSPSAPQQQLQADVAIPLGAPGNTVNVTIPKTAGGRIWFSIDARLTFLLNPGPAVVEPSVTNPSDPNFNINWAFCEFTFNDSQLFANVSYVDFVGIPIALSLTSRQGQAQSVPGIGPDGFQTIVNELRAQSQRDGRPWDQLIHEVNGQPIRALSPNNLLVETPVPGMGTGTPTPTRCGTNTAKKTSPSTRKLQLAILQAVSTATNCNSAKQALSRRHQRATYSLVVLVHSRLDQMRRAMRSFRVLLRLITGASC